MRSRPQLVVLGIIAALASCTVTAVTFSTGAPPAEDCSTAGDEDGNGMADCADPACADTPACKSVCGNGKLEAGEQCDDGNTVDGDGCESNCKLFKLFVCGNGILDTGEECDPGLMDSLNCNGAFAGSASCQAPSCGDSYANLAAGEECDTGGDTQDCNGNNGAESCRVPSCGDGYVNKQFTPPGSFLPEDCDNPGGFDTKICNGNNKGKNDLGSCRIPACGDGYVNTVVGEQCDDGNIVDGDGCHHDCTLEIVIP